MFWLPAALAMVHRNCVPIDRHALSCTEYSPSGRYQDRFPLISRSLGCAMWLPAPTYVPDGWALNAPCVGTPPSPLMVLLPLERVWDTIDHVPTALIVGEAVADA